MFLHIATNMKDMNKMKKIFEVSQKISIDDYKKEIYKVTDILNQKPEDRKKCLKKLYSDISTCRAKNVLVIIFYNQIEDIRKIDKNQFIMGNCMILEDNKYHDFK